MLQADLARLKRALEPLDSSRVLQLSAVESVHGKFYDVVNAYPRSAALALRSLRLFPSRMRNAVILQGLRGKGISEDEFLSLPLERLPDLVVSEWPGDGYAAALAGAPLGAVASLSALLKAPFLTTNFLFSIRDPKGPDDWKHALATASRLLGEIQCRRPDLFRDYEIIFHFDPLHDRFLVRWVTHIRLKLKRVPPAYESFLRERCHPHSPVVAIHCEYPWLQVPLGESAYLQVGGLGGVSPQEFLEKYPVRGRREGDYIERPESEWGTPREFIESVRATAGTLGKPFAEVRVSSPGELSQRCLAFFLNLPRIDRDSVAIDCFTYLQPLWLAQKGIPVYWLPFNTRDSLRELSDALKGLRFRRVFLDLVPSFAEIDDTVPYSEWASLLSGIAGEVVPVGVSPRYYPDDPYSVFMRSQRLRRLFREVPDRSPGPVSAEALISALTDRASL